MTVGPENVVVAELTELRSGPPVSGSLEAKRAATMRAEVSGSVLKTEADEGARVKRGAAARHAGRHAVRDAYLSARSQVRSAESALEVARRNAERADRLRAPARFPSGIWRAPARPHQRRRRAGGRPGAARGGHQAARGHPDPRAVQRSRERAPGRRRRRGPGGDGAVHHRGPAPRCASRPACRPSRSGGSASAPRWSSR